MESIHYLLQTLITAKPLYLLTRLCFQLFKNRKGVIEGFGLVLEIIYSIYFERWGRWAFLEDICREEIVN
jgi:hypothetical protein